MFALGVMPYVFRHGGYAAVPVGEDIRQQRLDVIGQLPKPAYARIFEPGCGGGSTLIAAHALHPEAELTGCDLSASLLQDGHRLAQRLGVNLRLIQRDGADTGEPDAHYDAVLTYALHHELPLDANRDLLREMLRILKPGGDILISDPPPFRAVDPFHAVILDWDNDHRAEPFFREACTTDWDAELSAIGFTDVQSYALGPASYPWVTRASKPA
jgi:SAM-dependent methyltransferase